MKKLLYISNLLTFCFLLSAATSRAQAPTIVTGPVNVTVCNGSAVMFTAYSADTAVHYAWEVYGTSWDSVLDGATYSGANTDTVRFTASASMNGFLYRVRAYNGAGISTFSANAVLTVDTAVTVGAITGSHAVCLGSSFIVTPTIGGGTWAVANTNASLTGTNTVTGDASGLDTLTYTFTNACGTSTSPIFSFRVDTVLAHATISGASAICTTTPATLTADVTGGTWSASNASATISGAGLLTGMASGIDTIRYINSNSCGGDTTWHIVTVDAPVLPSSIVGAHGLCLAGSTTLTVAVPGGTWSASNGTATVTGGVVTAVAVGIDTISYSVTNTCGTTTATHIVTIDTAIAASTLSGASAVCTSSSITLTATIGGGTWSTSNGTASVSSVGVVTGVAGGIDTIMYVNSNACNTTSAMHIVTIEVPVTTGSISGPASVCTGAAITLTVPAAGGTWSASNGNATITTTGVVSGVAGGLDTISYNVTNSCGTSSSTRVITIDTLLGHATVSGAAAVCISSTITLTASIAGGTWSRANASASVSAGSVTGVTAGIDTIIYTNVGVCNTDVATKIVTVDAPLTAGSISGPAGVCSGSAVSFTASTTGGAWFSSNTAVAVVDASGVVTGRSVGTTIISYAFSNACGTVVALDTIFVSRTASMITGSDSVGIGSTVSLADSAAGGTWSSSDTSIATISTTGVVSGLDTGMTTITYMVTNICGTSWSAKTIYVGPAPGAGVIYGPDSVCVGSAFAIVLGDTVAPGGTWSVTNGNGTISSAGSFTGIIGGTIDTVVYTVTNGFGTVSVTKAVRISSTPPHVTVTGPDTTSLSVGTTAFVLIGSPAGGTFTSADPTRVTFTTSTGNFVILRRGVVNLYYSYTNACGTGLDTFVVYLPLPSNINGFNAENAAVLNVYPNPNTGAFAMNLLSAYDEQAHVVVTNMVGQIVNEFNMPTNKANEISLNQPSGVYMVSATTNHGKYTTKVTITE